MNEPTSLELNHIQEKLFKNLLWVVPVVLGLMTTAILPLSIWLVQNAYMAQATATLVREMAIELKEQRGIIQELPPREWQTRIVRLEDSERTNIQAHANILISLEQIKMAVGAKP